MQGGDIPKIEKSHDTSTCGIVVGVNPDLELPNRLLGRMVYYRAYKDDARVGKDLALIEIKDILGVSDDTTTAASN